MYCQKCNRLLKNENMICEKCGFDNNIIIKKTLKESIIKKKKKPTKFLIIILLLCILTIILLTILVVYTNKTSDEITYDDVITTNDSINYTNEFKYKDLIMKYPDTWGSSTGTIFYKDYAKINITFRDITLDEYNQILDVNDCLDSEFGEIKTKTYAGDNSYAYTFNLNETYYLITVNYTSDNNVFTKSLQNEISDILSTLAESEK